MGVKLSIIIPKKEISFEYLENKKIAIDFSNMAYQFLSSIRQQDGTPLMDSRGNITSVYQGILSRISNLISRNIMPCFIFDGKSPILKMKTQEQRRYNKELAGIKLEKARVEGDEELMLRYSKQTSRLSKDIIKNSKEILMAMGLPVIQAPQEADAQLSHMCEVGDVDYVATSDIDPLFYGCPRTVTNLTLSQRRRLPSGAYVKITPTVIELKDVLSHLGINNDQLIALAILVGTDYNEGVKGIGPKTALKLVKEYKNFDVLFKTVNADFNWKKVYAVFKSMPIMKNYQLKWKEIDIYRLKKILVDQHDFSEERIDKTLLKLKEKDAKKHQKSLSDF